jgi:hypothetical protein
MQERRGEVLYFGDGWFLNCSSNNAVCHEEAQERQRKEQRAWDLWLVVMIALCLSALPIAWLLV